MNSDNNNSLLFLNESANMSVSGQTDDSLFEGLKFVYVCKKHNINKYDTWMLKDLTIDNILEEAKKEMKEKTLSEKFKILKKIEIIKDYQTALNYIRKISFCLFDRDEAAIVSLMIFMEKVPKRYHNSCPKLLKDDLFINWSKLIDEEEKKSFIPIHFSTPNTSECSTAGIESLKMIPSPLIDNNLQQHSSNHKQYFLEQNSIKNKLLETSKLINNKPHMSYVPQINKQINMTLSNDYEQLSNSCTNGSSLVDNTFVPNLNKYVSSTGKLDIITIRGFEDLDEHEKDTNKPTLSFKLINVENSFGYVIIHFYNKKSFETKSKCHSKAKEELAIAHLLLDIIKIIKEFNDDVKIHIKNQKLLDLFRNIDLNLECLMKSQTAKEEYNKTRKLWGDFNHKVIFYVIPGEMETTITSLSNIYAEKMKQNWVNEKKDLTTQQIEYKK